MAQRTISTKLAVEGESEYKQAIGNINNQLKTLETQLGLVKSEYQNNQNSMEALTSKSEVLADKQKLLTEKVEECKAGYANAKSSLDQYESTVTNTQAALEKNRTAQSQLSDEVKSAGTQWNEYKAKIADAESQLKNLDSSTGDTSEEEKRLNNVIDESKTAMEQLNNSTGGMAEQAGNLQTEEAELNEKLSQAEAGMDSASKSCESWEQQTNRAQTQLNDTNAEIELNDKYLEEAANSADGCATSIDNFGNKTGTAGDKLDKTNKSLDVMTAQMLQRELQKAFEALTDAIFACVDAAAEFEQQMSTVEAISGATSDEMDQLTAIAKEMGSTTSFTATEAGEALEYMALAGWDTNEMLDGLPAVLDLAAASGSDLANTSDIVTDALTAFGYQASDTAEFADTLATASSNSNTTVEQLGSAFQKVGPLAGTMGYSVEDVSEALGLMANSGIKAESAGTMLNTMLSRMSGTNSAAREELEKLNVEMYNTDGTARPLSDVIVDLRTAFQEMGDDTNAATEAAYNLAGQRGMAGLLAIVQSSDEDFEQLCGAVEDCNGAASEMAETKLDNYAGQVTLLESAWDGLKVELGEQMTPTLGGIVEWLTKIVNWITDFVDEHPWVVAALEAIAIAVGGLTAALTIMVGLKKLIDLLTNSLSMVQIGITMAVAVIGGLVAGIASLVSAQEKKLNPGVQESKERIDKLNDSMEELEDTIEDVDEAIEENADSTTFLKGAISDLLEKEELSELEKIKMADYVDQLNELYPELGLSIDETTGSLDMEADAFEEMIDAASGQAELSEYAKEQEAAEKALSEATDDLAESQRQQELVQAALSGDQDALNVLYHEGLISTNDMSEAQGKLQKLDKQLTKEIETESDALDEASGYYEECTKSCDELARAMSDMSDEEYDSYSKVGAQTEQLCADLMDLQAEYNEAKEAAKESASEQFGMFEEVEKEATKSADDIKKALESQQQYWKEFTNNLQDLQGRNIDGLEEMVNALNDGSTEAAANIASLADMTDEELTEMVEAYKGVEAEEDNYASVTADMSTEYQKQVQEMIDSFMEWVNSNEELTQEDKDYMVQMMDEYVNDVSDAEEDYEGALEHIDDSTREHFADSMGVATDETEKATDALKNQEKIIDKYADKIKPMEREIDNVCDKMKDLKDEYNEVRDAALDSAEQQFGAFEKVDDVVKTSSTDIKNALQSQIDYWKNYNDNLSYLYTVNIDGFSDMIAAIDDGSADAAGYLAGLRECSETELQEIYNSWLEAQKGPEEYATINAQYSSDIAGQMATLTEDLHNQMTDMMTALDFSEEAQESAWNVVLSYSNTLGEGDTLTSDAITRIVDIASQMLDFSPEAQQKAWDSISSYASTLEEGDELTDEAIQVILNGVRSEFGIAVDDARQAGSDTASAYAEGAESQSDTVIEAAKNTGETFYGYLGNRTVGGDYVALGEQTVGDIKKGIENATPDAEKQSEKSAKTIEGGLGDHLADGTKIGAEEVDDIAAGMKAEESEAVAAADKVSANTVSRLQKAADKDAMFETGVDLIKSFTNGINARSGSMYVAMQNAAQDALTRFKNVAGADALYVSGQNTIIGYINGLNNKSGSLYNSMQNIANNALTTFNNTLGVHSPSTETEWAAEKTIEGWVVGIDENADNAEESMAELARNALEEFTSVFTENMDTVIATAQQAILVLSQFAENTTDNFETVNTSTASLMVNLTQFEDILSTVNKTAAQTEVTVASFAKGIEKDFKTSYMSTNELTATLKTFDSMLQDTIKAVKSYATTTTLFKSGQDTITGYINGLNNQATQLYNTMQNIAKESLNTFNKTLGVNSPSKQTYSSATYTILGWIDGIKDGTASMEQCMADLAESAISAFNSSLSSTSAESAIMSNLSYTIEQALSSGFEPGSPEMNSLKASAKNAMDEIVSGLTDPQERAAMEAFSKSLMDAFDAGFSDQAMASLQVSANSVSKIFDSISDSGQSTITGYINGVNSQSSALTSTMSSTAQSALDTFNDTLGIHSPSTEMEESAENTINGWLRGIDKNTDDVETSMSTLASEAMDAFDLSLDSGLSKAAELDNLAATINMGNAEIQQNEKIIIEMPIYTGKTYTKTEIVEIAMDGINHKQINQYAAKGVTL